MGNSNQTSPDKPGSARIAAVVIAFLILGAGGFALFQRQPADQPAQEDTPKPSSEWATIEDVVPASQPSVQAADSERPASTHAAAQSRDESLTTERLDTVDLVEEKPDTPGKKAGRSFVASQTKNFLNPENELKIHWDGVPEDVQAAAVAPPDDYRNIRRDDYAGAESCRECHPENYEAWSGHAHRLMNAEATDETVRGDFSGAATLAYLGGSARFHTEGKERRMTLERDNVKRAYKVTRTLGSRFFQYYIGHLIEGPEPEDHPARKNEQLLPVGWWIDEREIVPIVHVHGEVPDQRRYDPFASPTDITYDRQCAVCHTTFAAGDWMMQAGGSLRLQLFTPRKVDFFASRYLSEVHPDLVDPERPFTDIPADEITAILRDKINTKINPHTAVNLGISCEACHLGCAQHAKNEKIMPPFFLSDPMVHLGAESPGDIWARTPLNKNWICSRCHSGGRPQYANKTDTWNSTDYSDAVEGFCYDAKKAQAKGMEHLTCVHCHDPHKGIGPKWSLTPREDDAKCVDCHKQYEKPEAVVAHTHHPMDSEGSRCMNCHMPKIVEGLQDMIRAHHISSPTDPLMIEANHPNACNLCHLDQPIDWTISHLREWHGEQHVYDQDKLTNNHRERRAPMGINYLLSPHEAVRLAASEALFKQRSRWALTGLVNMLDDPYLLNRQFTQKSFEQEFGVNVKEHGYRFTMTAEERREPIARIRKLLLGEQVANVPAPRSDNTAPR